MSKLLLLEKKCDLFTILDEYSLAHCVAADFRMSAGIAVKFSDKFGRKKELLDQHVKPGGVAVLKDKSRFIYYLVTKEISHGKPTYQNLYPSLQSMKTHMVRRKCFCDFH